MAVFVVGTVGAFIIFRRLFPAEISDDLKSAAAWGGLRIGTIHALILALVFTNIFREYNDLNETIENEALAIEQLYRELERIDSEETHAVQRQLTSYIRMVIDQEWPILANDGRLDAADQLVSDIRQNLINLSQAGEHAAVVAALMHDIKDVENMRGQRGFDTVESIPTVFWIITILGFALTSVCFFTHRATPVHCAILAMFAAINGAVLYSIIALTHPFVGGGAVAPTALETVFERTIAMR